MKPNASTTEKFTEDRVMTTSSKAKAQTSSWKWSLQTAVGSVIGAIMLLPSSAFANDWDYAKEPLFWNAGVKPNVALMIDDSGSMGAIVADQTFIDNKQTTAWQYCTNAACTSWPSVPESFSVAADFLGGATLNNNWTNYSTATTAADCSTSSNGFFKNSTGREQTQTYAATNFGICLAGHGLSNGDEITFTSVNNGSLPFAQGTKYYVMNASPNGFRLSQTLNGAAITLSNRRIISSTNRSGNFVIESNKLNYAMHYFNGTNAQLCDLKLPFGSTSNYLGLSGGKLTLKRSDTKSTDIGMVVRKNSSSTPKCVRWQMASTASSTAANAPNGAGNDYFSANTTGTSYEVPGDGDALRNYGNHLLNQYATAAGNINFDESTVIPGVNRMQAAREAAQKVVLDYYDRMNIGLFSFMTKDSQRDGEMNIPFPRYSTDSEEFLKNRADLIGSTLSMSAADMPISALDGAIGLLRPEERTPLAKTMNVITTQFKKPYGAAKSDGPIAYRCQKNYAIIMTDGEPTDDENTLNQRAFEAYQDLVTSGNDLDGKGFGSGDPNRSADVDAWKVQNIVTYTIGFGVENDLLKKTPLTNRILIPASSIVANAVTTTSAHGLATGDPVLVNAAQDRATTISTGNRPTVTENTTLKYAAVTGPTAFKVADSRAAAISCAASNSNCANISGGQYISTGPGKSFFSTTAEQLTADLSSVFKDMETLTASASSVSANSKRVDGESLVYQAKFSTKGWSGEVVAYPIDVSGTKASVDTKVAPTTKGWTTKNTMKSVGDRELGKSYTWSLQSSSPISFTASAATYNALADDQKASLGTNQAEAIDTISWLQGNQPTNKRARMSENGLLGDVVNADPVYVGAPNFGYGALPASEANCSGSTCSGKESYEAFVQANKQRTPVLMVGTNHGYVHALNANTGEELMSYVPAGVYSDWVDEDNNGVRSNNEAAINKFDLLSKPNYNHEFFVDGSAAVGDAYLSGAWSTYFVGGLGAGGRSVYALDVTSTSKFNTAVDVVKWEVSTPELGYSYGEPLIVRMKDGNWYAIVPNGLDSKDDVARVLIIDLESGQVEKILTGLDTSGPNGMMSVQVRLDATRTVLDIYAGDIRGNIWRFDVSGTSSGSWSTNGSKVFSARDGTRVQSITGGLRLGAHPSGLGTIVYFGTGKYFEIKDKTFHDATIPQVDAFYAVLDGRNGATVDKDQLKEQKIGGGPDYRTMTSSTEVNWDGGDKGWFINLPDTGERVTSTPILWGGRIIFTSIVPSGAGSCDATGYSWLNEVDAFTGKQIDKPVLDLDGDGIIEDHEEGTSARIDGLASDPSVLTGGEIDYKLMGTTHQVNSITLVAETQVEAEGLKGGSGRMSWQQLQ